MPLPMYSPDRQTVKNIIAVGAGKGGVGKSTVACELAASLAKQGKSVGLLDTDMYGPSVGRMLKLEKRAEKERDRFIPGESQGIKLMTMAFFQEAGDGLIARAPIVTRTLSQLIQKVSWGECDYLILDLPPGTGDIPLTLGQELNISGVVLVTTPQKVACDDVVKAGELFNKLQVPILGVFENMAYFEVNGVKSYPFGKGGAKYLAELWQVPLLGEIPIDPAISEAGDSGIPVSISKSNPEIAQCFSDATEGLQRLLEESKNRNSAFLRHFHLKWEEMEHV